MKDMEKAREFTYMGAGFPVKLIGFPFKKVAGEEILDMDMEKLDLAIARLVLVKPAFLTGKEIRFLRQFLGESMATFGGNFGVTAAAVKKWEDLNDHPMGLATNDFAIRNYASKKLSGQYEMHINIAVHKSILEAGEFWKPEMEIPFEAMTKFLKNRGRNHVAGALSKDS